MMEKQYTSKYQNKDEYKDTFDYKLLNYLGSPCKYDNIFNILEKIDNESKLGKNLILYEKYIKYLGDDGLSSNIIVPYLDHKPKRIMTQNHTSVNS